MKKSSEENGEMLPEYDFRGGVRGKHHKAYREGHTVTVHKEDGNFQVQDFMFEDGPVLFEWDVRKYFADSETVDRACAV